MPKKEKTVSKEKHYFSLNIKVNDAFKKFIKENAISKPKLIENLIIQYLEKNNIKIND